ncbi:MAG TPA: hypothetical protein PKM88_12910, partial [bacterium]|nr:hypothetical protein [bacterium]
AAYNDQGQITTLTRQIPTALGALEIVTDNYEYDALGRMTAHVAPDGTRTEYAHNDAGRITEEIVKDVAVGEETTLSLNNATSYDGNGAVTSQTDAGGNTIKFEYDNHERVVREEWEESLAPDASVTLCFVTHAYNAAGLETAQNGNAAEQVALSYHPNGLLAAKTTDGVLEEFAYDAAGRLREWGAEARETKRTYSTNHIITKYSGAATSASLLREYTEEQQYDDLGRVTQITGRDDYAIAMGSATPGLTLTNHQYKYDAHGRLAQEILGGGSIAAQYEYDANNLLMSVNGPGDYEYDCSYNTQGWLTSQTENGITRKYEYDILGRVVKEYLVSSGTEIRVVERGYNGLGWVLWEKQGGIETKYAYDANGRVVRAGVTGSGSYETYEYSGLRGLLLRKKVVADGTEGSVPEGTILQEWRFGYDARGGVLWEESPGGYRCDYTYNSNHQLVSVADNAGRSQAYTYNEYGEAATATAAGATTEYGYNARGWCDRVGLPGGPTTQVRYDGLGRVAELTEPTGAHAVLNYQVDYYSPYQTAVGSGPTCILPGGMTPLYKITAGYSPTGLLQNREFGTIREANVYAHERLQLGHVVHAGLPPAARKQTVGYDWSNGLPAGVEHNGRTTTCVYDNHGRPERTLSGYSGTAAPRQTIAYDAAGRISRLGLPFGGRYVKREYTPDGLLANETLRKQDVVVGATTTPGEQLWRSEYEYDAAGNRIAELVTGDASTGATPRGYRHEYDQAGRITASEDDFGNRREYSYDARNNRLTESEWRSGVLWQSISATYNNRDELLTRTATGNSGVLLWQENSTYDDNGRLASVVTAITAAAATPASGLTAGTTTKTYGWDNFNHLAIIQFSDSRPAIVYTYDGGGRRVRRDCGSDSTVYIYDQTTDNVVTELDGCGR